MPFAPLHCPPPGATIAIVAPAGPATDAAVRAVPALLAERGYEARLYPSCEARDGYLAGSDAARLADLHEAIALNTYARAELARLVAIRTRIKAAHTQPLSE